MRKQQHTKKTNNRTWIHTLTNYHAPAALLRTEKNLTKWQGLNKNNFSWITFDFAFTCTLCTGSTSYNIRYLSKSSGSVEQQILQHGLSVISPYSQPVFSLAGFKRPHFPHGICPGLISPHGLIWRLYFSFTMQKKTKNYLEKNKKLFRWFWLIGQNLYFWLTVMVNMRIPI